MIKGYKVKLSPSKAQEELMFKQAGCERFAYNWYLTYCDEYYKAGVKTNPNEASKALNAIKREAYPFLMEVSQDPINNAKQKLQEAFKKFFDKKAQHPKPKTRKSKISFYVDNRKIAKNLTNKSIKLEKIGEMRYRSDYLSDYGERISFVGCKLINPRVGFDGKHWHLSFSVNIPDVFNLPEGRHGIPNGMEVGIDLGIKTLATCNNGKKYKNINKTKRVKRLKTKRKRLSKSISRSYQMNKNGNKYIKTKNIAKKERQIRIIDRQLTNIRNNYIHKMTNEIIKRQPSKIALETLNVRGMMKNKRKHISECKFYEIRRQLEYKAKQRLGIEIINVPTFYPSSKLCSCCGYKYTNSDYERPWSLKIRKWTCVNCKTTHDRDMNASINIANYSETSQAIGI